MSDNDDREKLEAMRRAELEQALNESDARLRRLIRQGHKPVRR